MIERKTGSQQIPFWGFLWYFHLQSKPPDPSRSSSLRWQISVLASGQNENHSPSFIFFKCTCLLQYKMPSNYSRDPDQDILVKGCYNLTLSCINLYSRQFQHHRPAALTTLGMLSMCHKTQLCLRTAWKATTCTLLPSTTNFKILRISSSQQMCPNWNCWVFWCKKDTGKIVKSLYPSAIQCENSTCSFQTI